jgi:hypothetical protein
MARIHTFLGNRIAFYKPRKHTYYLLAWSNTRNFWVGSALVDNPPPVIVKHRTTRHVTSSVTIQLQNGRSTSVLSRCEYLLIGNEEIPIVYRIGEAQIPLNISRYEFGGVTTPVEQDVYTRNVLLWTLPPPEPPPAAPPVAAPPVADNIKPLPKRIAWIIAEDACKNNETCPIIMEPISPITAAVSTCFHCFDHEAIMRWLDDKDTCPQCREKCAVTKAFD